MKPLRQFASQLLITCIFLPALPARGEKITVRHTEGTKHGFLVLRNADGEILADGDLVQEVNQDRVTCKLVFHFKDGSVQEETTTYSQRGALRVLSDRLVQKGPSFPHPIDVGLESSGKVTVRSLDDKGKESVTNQNMKLPPDLANGVLYIAMMNLKDGSSKTELPLLVATPKPRLVKLVITAEDEEPFWIGGFRRNATRYLVKMDIGGVAGVVAPLIGKQPADAHVWILGGEVPVLVRSDGQLFPDGPVWRIEMTGPSWQDPGAASVRSASAAAKP